MEKKQKDSKEIEESIIYNTILEDNYENNQKILLFITEYMSLSLKDKISKYLNNKYIRSIINPITSDTLIHYLCKNDDNFPLIELIKPNPIEREQKNNLGQTILHIATQNKSYKIIEYLLENGSNINSKDNKNNTPLHIAVKLNDYEIIQLLLKYTPIMNILNDNKETPIDISKSIKNRILNKVIYDKEKSEFTKSCNNLNNIKNNFYKTKKLELNNKSLINNLSINNCSLETKNETSNNQSLNIYKKKIISNSPKFSNENIIKNNKTINLKRSIINNYLTKKYSYNNLNILSPLFQNNYIYRKTSPKMNNKYTLIEFNDDSEICEYTPKKKCISPKVLNNNNIELFKFQSKKINNINNNQKIIYENYNYFKKCKSNKIIYSNNYCPLILNGNDNTNNEIKKIRKTIIHKTPFTYYKQKLNKEDLCKQKLLEFLKEIGMQNYGDILISEGFDDIDLILKQMNEGFPLLEDTLKEIGTIPAGDRAKILIRLQEISNGFNFDFPFEIVYFKNNGSILKWLNGFRLSKYNKNFIDVGYQSLELLLIQMASKFKINENTLINELFILNDKDRINILKSLEIDSEKYVKELSKNHNIERTYSKMVKKDSDSICIII